MPIKLFKLEDLQPTDSIRAKSIRFFESIGIRKTLLLYARSYVYETSKGLLISNGNNRIAFLAGKGYTELEVDYQKMPKESEFLLHASFEGAERLKKQGIYSPYDLWNSWIKT